jgi:dephospho-CoA kinase
MTERPFLIGLTGSVGMGKSTTAEMFAALGFPVFDADAAVHSLYGLGGAGVEMVGSAFPGSVTNGAVDRRALARLLGDDHSAFERLEALVHPLVTRESEKFIEQCAAKGKKAAILNIPLLFETGEANRMDVVLVVSAPEHVQLSRVLTRPGMTKERFDIVSSRQWPDAEKRQAADFVIQTGEGLERTLADVKKIAAILRRRAGEK